MGNHSSRGTPEQPEVTLFYDLESFEGFSFPDQQAIDRDLCAAEVENLSVHIFIDWNFLDVRQEAAYELLELYYPEGTLDSVLVHPREVFASAISRKAAAIILAHNHPSGDPNPSEADIRITRDLIRAGQLLKIEVLDHFILGQATDSQPREFRSLKEIGYFYR